MPISASPIYVGDRIYFFSEEGMTTVVEPGTDYFELAKNQLDGRIMATPAVVGDALYVRTDENLYRIQ
jgi:outer membrane protein assembly factor BamB